jgi:hypothetical protein
MEDERGMEDERAVEDECSVERGTTSNTRHEIPRTTIHRRERRA